MMSTEVWPWVELPIQTIVNSLEHAHHLGFCSTNDIPPPPVTADAHIARQGTLMGEMEIEFTVFCNIIYVRVAILTL
jgi:hypothetical protein